MLGAVPQASAASSLLADALAPEEWATFRHVMTLMRTALEPAHAAANGLTLVLRRGAAGGGLVPAAAALRRSR